MKFLHLQLQFDSDLDNERFVIDWTMRVIEASLSWRFGWDFLFFCKIEVIVNGDEKFHKKEVGPFL